MRRLSVSQAAQHAAKKSIVERALGIEIPPVIAAVAPFGYRDRARLTVAGGAVGFKAWRSHDVVDVGECPLFSPALARALPAVRALGARLPDGSALALQAGGEGVHLDVTPAGAAAAARALGEQCWDALRAGGVVGVTVDGKPALGAAAVDVSEPGGAPLQVPAGAFAQSGRTANAALVAAVMDAVGKTPGAVIELCAGSGNFTRHLVPVASSVRASDTDAGAVARGRRAAPAATWSRRPPEIPPEPAADLVLLDPPREGADDETLAAAQKALRRVVYVSCDPQTLARDARRLTGSGFLLMKAVALDLMPQTYHIEVVAIFDRP